MLRSTSERDSLRWLMLGLSAHGLAAVLLLTNVLSSSSERVQTPAHQAPAPAVVPAGSPAPSVARPAQREPMRAEPDALAERVRDTAEALAKALEAPEYEDVRWRADVRDHARVLGPGALPALEALLADATRPVEEHVAASELVAALREP